LLLLAVWHGFSAWLMFVTASHWICEGLTLRMNIAVSSVIAIFC